MMIQFTKCGLRSSIPTNKKLLYNSSSITINHAFSSQYAKPINNHKNKSTSQTPRNLNNSTSGSNTPQQQRVGSATTKTPIQASDNRLLNWKGSIRTEQDIISQSLYLANLRQLWEAQLQQAKSLVLYRPLLPNEHKPNLSVREYELQQFLYKRVVRSFVESEMELLVEQLNRFITEKIHPIVYDAKQSEGNDLSSLYIAVQQVEQFSSAMSLQLHQSSNLFDCGFQWIAQKRPSVERSGSHFSRYSIVDELKKPSVKKLKKELVPSLLNDIANDRVSYLLRTLCFYGYFQFALSLFEEWKKNSFFSVTSIVYQRLINALLLSPSEPITFKSLDLDKLIKDCSNGSDTSLNGQSKDNVEEMVLENSASIPTKQKIPRKSSGFEEIMFQQDRRFHTLNHCFNLIKEAFHNNIHITEELLLLLSSHCVKNRNTKYIEIMVHDWTKNEKTRKLIVKDQIKKGDVSLLDKSNSLYDIHTHFHTYESNPNLSYHLLRRLLHCYVFLSNEPFEKKEQKILDIVEQVEEKAKAELNVESSQAVSDEQKVHADATYFETIRVIQSLIEFYCVNQKIDKAIEILEDKLVSQWEATPSDEISAAIVRGIGRLNNEEKVIFDKIVIVKEQIISTLLHYRKVIINKIEEEQYEELYIHEQEKKKILSKYDSSRKELSEKNTDEVSYILSDYINPQDKETLDIDDLKQKKVFRSVDLQKIESIEKKSWLEDEEMFYKALFEKVKKLGEYSNQSEKANKFSLENYKQGDQYLLELESEYFKLKNELREVGKGRIKQIQEFYEKYINKGLVLSESPKGIKLSSHMSQNSKSLMALWGAYCNRGYTEEAEQLWKKVYQKSSTYTDNEMYITNVSILLMWNVLEGDIKKFQTTEAIFDSAIQALKHQSKNPNNNVKTNEELDEERHKLTQLSLRALKANIKLSRTPVLFNEMIKLYLIRGEDENVMKTWKKMESLNRIVVPNKESFSLFESIL